MWYNNLMKRQASNIEKITNIRGFSIIHVLIIICIIGIIANFIFISLRGNLEDTRDNKRIHDMKLIQTAVELYFSESATGYPTPSSWQDLATDLSEFADTLPIDPKNTDKGMKGYFDPSDYAYVYSVNTDIENDSATSFVVSCRLENQKHKKLLNSDKKNWNAEWETKSLVNSLFIAGPGSYSKAAVDCSLATQGVYCLTENKK